MEPRKFDLEERLLNYAATVIKLTDHMPKTRAGNHVAGQLLRAGTSPLANHGEAQSAESPKDFTHKMRVCLKELRESYRWLCLIKRIPLIKPFSLVDSAIIETDELIRIFVASIKTAENKENTR